MAWKGLTLTRDGQSVLNNAQVSDRMNIKSIAIGDGAAPADFRNLKGLVNKLHEITDLKIEMVDGQCTLTADLPQVNYDYTFREIGVIVTTDDGEKLYVYDNCGADAQRIISSTGVETTKKRIRLFLEISDVAKITVSTPSILYVAYDEFEEKMDRIDASINDKVGKEPGKGLSANDYTDQEKAKLQGIEEGANNYTHPATHPADMIDQDATHRFVTDLEKQVWGGAYAQATAYADQQIADLINGAPETLNTLGEIAKAMQDNGNVVDALEHAIGTKASQADVDGHTGNNTIHVTASERQAWNSKQTMTGDTKDNTVSFVSGDSANLTGWTDVELIESKEKHSNLLHKVSLFAKNVRYLWKLMGSKSLNGIGDGTVTGAISQLKTEKANSSHTHNYLPLEGGAITGTLQIPNLCQIKYGNWGIYAESDQMLKLQPKEAPCTITIGVTDSMWAIAPWQDRAYQVGTPSHRFGNIYAYVGTIQTSDRAQKQDIESIDDKYMTLFSHLQPVSYTLVDGTSGRTHIGFVSQDVEAAMTQSGLSDLDFAGFCKDRKKRAVRQTRQKLDDAGNPLMDKDGLPIVEEYISYEDELDSDGNPIYIYSLRYEEFIALNTAMIQLLQKKIAELEHSL